MGETSETRTTGDVPSDNATNINGKRRGILCPGCGAKMTRVYETTPTGAGIITRYRKCADCGTRVATRERITHVVRRGRRKSK